jgi:hypothetical protein
MICAIRLEPQAIAAHRYIFSLKALPPDFLEVLDRQKISCRVWL